MIAAVPGTKNETAKYLKDLGVIVDDIVNVSLSDIHVSAIAKNIQKSSRVHDLLLQTSSSSRLSRNPNPVFFLKTTGNST